jgi:hypothetical protein
LSVSNPTLLCAGQAEISSADRSHSLHGSFEFNLA